MPPDYLPRQLPASVDDLVIFAEQSVRRGFIGIGTPNAVNDVDTLTWFDARGSSYSDVVSQLSAARLRFKPLGPKGWYNAWVQLQNTEGYTLLNASVGFRLELREGRYVVPDSARRFSLLLNNSSFQHHPGVERIDYSEENEEGEVVFTHSVFPLVTYKGGEQQSDLFPVPAYFSQNKKGSVVFYVRVNVDGGLRGFAYDMRTGKMKVTPVQDTGPFTIGTQDVFRFIDKQEVLVEVANNRRPILHLTYTKASPVKFKVTGTWKDVKEYPNGGTIQFKAPGSDVWETEPFSQADWTDMSARGVNTEKGEYYIRFTFPSYGSDSDRQFDRPYQGDGGGKG